MTIPKPIEGSWVNCNSCRKAIAYGQKYWVCNVSTCNRKRTGLRFCSVTCWDAHQPMMNHRESWAEERVAPESAKAWEEEQNRKPERIKKESEDKTSAPPTASAVAPKAILRKSR